MQGAVRRRRERGRLVAGEVASLPVRGGRRQPADAARLGRRVHEPVTHLDMGAHRFETTQTLKEGTAEIEARLMIPLEEEQPVILGKVTNSVTIASSAGGNGSVPRGW